MKIRSKLYHDWHPSIQHVLTLFTYEHLRGKMRNTSRMFYTLAWDVAEAAPDSIETTHALRKLLEAKDCAVRALLEYVDVT